jgi:hypothetical protein
MIAKANNMIMNHRPFDTLMVPEFPAGVMVKTSPSPSAPAPQAGGTHQSGWYHSQ